MTGKPRLIVFAPHFAEYSTHMVEALSQYADVLFVLDRKSRLDECDPRWFDKATAGVRLMEFRSERSAMRWLWAPFVLARCLMFRPDLVHIQEHPDQLTALVARVFARRTPVALTVHDPNAHMGCDEAIEKGRRRRRRKMLREAATLFHVHGEYCRRQLLEVIGDAHPIISTHHGIIHEPSPDEERHPEPGRILFFGRMQEYKGIDVLLTAFEHLNAKGRNYTLVLAGEGPALDEKRAARTPGIILLNRFIPRDEAIAELQKASLVALPYLEATQSGVAAAAIGNGRAMVASAVGGLVDVIRHGENGLLVPPADPEKLAGAIDRILQDPVLLETLSAGSRQSREDLSWARVAMTLNEAYSTVIWRGVRHAEAGEPRRLPSTTARRRRETHVVIATPLGERGKGGIDRLIDMIRAYARAHPDPAFSLHFVTTRGKGSLLLSPVYLLSAAVKLAWLKARGRADVLHVNIVQRGSAIRKLILCGLARRLGVPYVLHLHGGRFPIYWDSVGSWLSARLTAAFSDAARTIVLGQVWNRYISGRAPRARIEIVPNATFAPRLEPCDRPSEAPIHILFLGKIGANKGVPELLQALAMLPQNGAWRATLAGDGEVDDARSTAARLDLRNVTVRGWADPPEVDALLRGADVLVLPSHHECLPLSVIEGMAYGLAVVTTPVGAVPEIIVPGETGLLCPPGDPTALAEALHRVISDPGLRRRLGRSAQSFHREHLDVPAFVHRMKSIWEQAARTPAAPVMARGSGIRGAAQADPATPRDSLKTRARLNL